MTPFLQDPIETLKRECRNNPVAKIPLFDLSAVNTVISGEEINRFVAKSDIWDIPRNNICISSSFGDKHISVLSGKEHAEKHRKIRLMSQGASEEILKNRIRELLKRSKGYTLRFWCSHLALYLSWDIVTKGKKDCPIDVLYLYEQMHQAGTGLVGEESKAYYSSPQYAYLSDRIKECAGIPEEEWIDTSVFFTGATIALSLIFAWIVIYFLNGIRGNLSERVRRERPPFLLAALWPSRSFEAFGERFNEYEVIYHAFVLPQLLSSESTQLYGVGPHACPVRNTSDKMEDWFSELVQESDINLSETPSMEYAFNGFLIPKYDYTFL